MSTIRFLLLTTRNHIPRLRFEDLYQFRRIPFGVTNAVACFQCSIDEILKVEGIKDTVAYIDNVTVFGFTKGDHDENLDRFLKAATKMALRLTRSKP